MENLTVSAKDLREKLEQVENIPALPTIVQDIMAVTEDPNSGLKDVQAVVERDQSCTLKLLKLANSAYYGFSRQITTVKQAIVIIGLEGVKSAAMSLEMAGCFLEGAGKNKEIIQDLWVHSMAVATAAQTLAKHSGEIPASMAYLSGLIHDFGKVILAGHFGSRYLEIFVQAKEEKVPIAILEQSELGIDHETVASWVSEAWDLPEAIRDVGKYHHSGFHLDQSNKAILIVGLADALAYNADVGDGGNGRPFKVDETYLNTVGLDPAIVDEIISDLKNQADRFASLLGTA